jgi:hypothetical protein
MGLAILGTLGGMIKRQHPTTSDGEAPVATWSPGPRGPARIYKNRHHQGSKKAHRCLACFPHSRAGQRIPLAHGVSLVLCAAHRDPRFIASRNGRDFLSAVGELFAALGLTARRYGEALRRFVKQIAEPDKPIRARPGSYAWAARRRDAETVWSRGGSFHQGLHAALADPPDPRARAAIPTSRTIRRWWQERRWLQPPPEPEPALSPA